jgi:hypothetical protein
MTTPNPTAKPTPKPTATPQPTPAPTMAPTLAPVPSTCSNKAQYRAPGGCRNCISRSSPYTKNYGGVLCYQPTTLSARSTVCTAVVLPAFVRNEASKRNTRSCIPATQRTVNIFLVTKNSQVPFLKSSSYIRTALRLANQIPPRRLDNGQVLFIKDGINNRQLIQFVDRFGVLRKRRGKTVQLTGVLNRGSGLLPYCFVAYLRVCA